MPFRTVHGQLIEFHEHGCPLLVLVLSREAKKEGVSLSEFVRQRCLKKPSEDEAALAALVGEVRQAAQKAQTSLEQGLRDAEGVLAELRSSHK